MKWSTAQARERLSQLVRAADDEPQVITNRGRPVAVVIDPEEYEAFRRWRERHSGWTMAELLDGLKTACQDEDYEWNVVKRGDRPNAFAEGSDELPR